MSNFVIIIILYKEKKKNLVHLIRQARESFFLFKTQTKKIKRSERKVKAAEDILRQTRQNQTKVTTILKFKMANRNSI